MNNNVEIFYGLNSGASSGTPTTIAGRLEQLENFFTSEVTARKTGDNNLGVRINDLTYTMAGIVNDEINLRISGDEALSNALNSYVNNITYSLNEINVNHTVDISNINSYIDTIQEDYLKSICINNSYGVVTSPNLASVTLDGSYVEVGPQYNSYLEGEINSYDSIATAISKLANSAGTTGFLFDDKGDIEGITIAN